MAFDDKTRNRLSKFVSDVRKLLSDEFAYQLRNVYGLDPETGDVTDVDSLPTLSDADRQTTFMLRELFEHYLTGVAKRTTTSASEILDRIVREQAFTVLNRLCAIRMAEARELVIESIARGYQSKGFQLYTRLVGNALGETGDAYVAYIFSTFDECALDLPVLFDRFSEHGRLFPREAVLLKVLQEINHHELAHLWCEDETIGWIYQFFNSKEERRQMRENTAPRNSRELAVRNQFFTPRYVVEFLTDNTLGRIWYEMRQGNTRLVNDCKYLVRRSDEVFFSGATCPVHPDYEESVAEVARQLAEGNADDFAEFAASSDAGIQRMINLAQTAAVQISDDPTERPAWMRQSQSQFETQQFDSFNTGQLLEYLCLACHVDRQGGDGGTYRSDWFVACCNEVRRRALNSRNDDLPQEEMLKQPVFINFRPLKDPRDIRMLDPACGSMHFGLYAFDLYLKIYDEAWDIGCEFNDRIKSEYASKHEFERDTPRLIVERNIHGIDIDPRAVQIAGLSLWLRAQKAWQLQGVASIDRPKIAHSHVVCAEPMPGDRSQLEEFAKELHPAIAHMVKQIFGCMVSAGEAGSMLRIEKEIEDVVGQARRAWLSEPKAVQKQLFGQPSESENQLELDLSGVTNEAFFDRAESEIVSALKLYAESTRSSTIGFRRKLFANDAAQGFSFVNVSSRKFDAILMNPPFGAPADTTREYLKSEYVASTVDVAAVFIERATSLLSADGAIGVLATRLLQFVGGLSDWRASVMLGRTGIELCADLGYGVLDDAVVEVSASVIRDKAQIGVFFGLLQAKDKETVLRDYVTFPARRGHVHRLANFAALSENTVPYFCSSRMISRVAGDQQTSNSGTEFFSGLNSGDDFRFLRLAWEAPVSRMEWLPVTKGGGYRPIVDDVYLRINWKDDGYAIKNLRKPNGYLVSRPLNLEKQLRPGLYYSYRTTSDVALRVMPRGCIFTMGGPVALSSEVSDSVALLFLGYTRPIKVLIELLFGGGDSSVSGTAARNYRPGVLNSLPHLDVPPCDRIAFEEKALDRLRVACDLRMFDETSPHFSKLVDVFAKTSTSFASLISVLWVFRYSRISSGLSTAAFFEDVANKLLGFHDEEMQAFDEIYGPHPEFLPNEHGDPAKIRDLAESSIDTLVELAVDRIGGKRAATKKAFFVDRRVELSAIVSHCKASLVANELAKHEPANWFKKDIAFSLVSYFLGRTFGRLFPLRIPDNSTVYDIFDNAEPSDWYVKESNDRITVLVNDQSHNASILRAVETVAEEIWEENVNDALGQLFATLGTEPSRFAEWLEKEFFEEHLSRYSRSRRQAPIYWPVSSKKSAITVWVYFHDVNDQTLFKVVNDFVEPRLSNLNILLRQLQSQASRSSEQENEMAKLSDEKAEVTEYRDELLRVAKFWRPELADGVQITACPLWSLIRSKKWRDKLHETWQDLEDGEHDWANLAISIWPDRVVKEKAVADRRIAIAHDLEEQLWHEVDVRKTSKTGRVTTKREWQPKDLTDAELGAIVAEVKAR